MSIYCETFAEKLDFLISNMCLMIANLQFVLKLVEIRRIHQFMLTQVIYNPITAMGFSAMFTF